MTYSIIIDTLILVVLFLQILLATFTRDPQKEVRSLAWAALLLLAYIARNMQ